MAIQRTLAPGKFLDKGTVLLQATIAGNNTVGSIAFESGTSKGLTFTRNDVGDYTISGLGSGSVDIQGVWCQFEGAARKEVWPAARTLTGGGSIDLLVETPSTEAVAAAAADLADAEAAHILIWVKNTSAA